MRDILLLHLAQLALFTLCWIVLPFRNNQAAWFRKKLYRREQFIVFAIAFVLSIVPVGLSLQVGYGRALVIADLNVGSCLLVSLLWRPRYIALSTRAILARIVASYIWPLAAVYPLGEFARARCSRQYATTS